MIKEDKYLGYDYDRHEYFIKEQALVELTPLQDAEIKKAFPKLEQNLQLASQRIYNYIYSKNTKGNKKLVHFKIYQDTEGERQAVLDAILQYIMASWHSDMDLNAYQDEQHKDVPYTAHDILAQAKLFNLPQYRCDFKGDY